MQKIEELTLYMIELKKENELLQRQKSEELTLHLTELKKENAKLHNRLAALESR